MTDNATPDNALPGGNPGPLLWYDQPSTAIEDLDMKDNATPKPLSEKRIEQLRELYRPGSHYRSGDIEGLLAYIDALKAQPTPEPQSDDEQAGTKRVIRKALIGTGLVTTFDHLCAEIEINALKAQPAPVPLAEDEALIAEIRARCHAATAAPWVADISPDGSLADVNHATLVDELGEPQTVALCDIIGNNENDACFIAHSREDIPALLERLSLRSGQLARVLALKGGPSCNQCIRMVAHVDEIRAIVEGEK